MASPRSIVGARARLFLGGKEVGFVTRISAREDRQLEAVDVIGDLYTKELPEVGIVVTGNCQMVVLSTPTLEERGIVVGKSTREIILAESMDLQILDVVGEQSLFKLSGARFSGFSIEVAARQVVLSNVDFRAIKLEIQA